MSDRDGREATGWERRRFGPDHARGQCAWLARRARAYDAAAGGPVSARALPKERVRELSAQAEESLRLAYAHSRAHSKLAQWADNRFGEGDGQFIAGVVRNHYPERVKSTLRYLARRVSFYLDSSRNTWRYAGRRHGTWMRAKELTIARDGRGFYG